MRDLLKKLISTAPTHENGELQAANVLAEFFENHGIPAEVDCWDEKRANIVASIGPNDPDAPVLVLGVHLDVVPAKKENWQSDPFAAVEKDGRIYGRGAVDMQGGICAAAQAVTDIHASGKPLKGRVIFAATAGEETDSCGAKRFIEKYQDTIQNPVGVLIPEPTGLEILRAHRGILWLKVQTFGKTAHGSMPHLGINAILKMNALLNRLKDYQIPHTPHPLLGGCSMSINRIAGGSGTNIVPDGCAAELDIRVLPGQGAEEVIGGLMRICDTLKQDDPEFRAEISVIRSVDALETDGDCAFVKTVCAATGIGKTSAAGFTTDGPIFAKLGAPVIIFGPGDGTCCHKPNEYIEIEQMDRGRELYRKILDDFTR